MGPVQGKASALVGIMIVGLGTIIVPLDTSVNIAFPNITTDFSIPISNIQWVVVCYVLTYTSLMLICGKLGDLYGHKQIFFCGLVISSLAFISCGMAPTYHWLLISRTLQGLGGALVLSCGPALATSLFSEKRRTQALGAYTMMFGIGAAMGPLLGGFMVQAWGWESVFWFRLPLTLIAIAALPLLPAAKNSNRGGSFDLLGAMLLALGLCGVLLAINQIQADAIRGIAIALLGFGGLLAFVLRELRSPDPIIPLAVFRHLDFTMLHIINSLVNLVGFASLLLVPYYLVRATDYSLGLSGALLASGPLGIALSAPIGGWLLSRRAWASQLGLSAAILVAISTIIMGTWDATASIWSMSLPMLAQGVGLGLFQVCILDVVTDRLHLRDRGVAGSLAMVTRTIGVVLGATSLSLGFATLRQTAQVSGLTTDAAFLSAFQTAFIFSGVALLICLAITLIRPRLWFN